MLAFCVVGVLARSALDLDQGVLFLHFATASALAAAVLACGEKRLLVEGQDCREEEEQGEGSTATLLGGDAKIRRKACELKMPTKKSRMWMLNIIAMLTRIIKTIHIGFIRVVSSPPYKIF